MTIVTADAKASTGKTAEHRAARYAAQRMLWKRSSMGRVRHCGSSMSKLNGAKGHEGTAGQTVKVKSSDGVAGFSGLQTCGSPWACPVCSGKIMTVRAGEVQEAVNVWHKTYRRRVAFLTLTMRHHNGQKLSDLWDALSYAWDKATGGSARAWERDCDLYGSPQERTVLRGARKGQKVVENKIQFIRAVEVTQGAKGWHVHIHALLFLRDGVDDIDVQRLSESIYGRWEVALVEKGLTAPTPEHGVDIKLVRRNANDALGPYIAKSVYVGRVKAKGAGWEIAGGMGKKAGHSNRTPFQILADIVADGDDSADLLLWWEFEKASKGRRQMVWSHGFRAKLGLLPEKDDKDITDEELGGAVVMEFDKNEWRWLRMHKAEILALVEAGAAKPLVLASVQRRMDRLADDTCCCDTPAAVE